MAIEKIKILGAVLELPAKQHCQTSPFISKLGQIFSIVLGAQYLSYVKSIETHARAFLTLNILSIGTVYCLITIQIVTIIVPKIAPKLTSQFSTKLYLRSAKGFPDLKSTKLKFACICI